MEKTEKKRTLPEVQQEYANLCSKAGQIQYQISCLQEDLSVLNRTLRDLNFEASRINSEMKKEAELKAEIEQKIAAQKEAPNEA